jgi:hypothetical protein
VGGRKGGGDFGVGDGCGGGESGEWSGGLGGVQ